MKTLADPRDQAALLHRIRLVRPDSVRRWGRMTAHQMVCHLGDAFRIATGERIVAPHANLFNRTILKCSALYLPLPWPRGIPTTPEVDQLQGGRKPTDFVSDLADAASRLEGFIAADVEGRPHPYFGPLSRAAWLRWGYLHTDHHLRQFGA